ncbi:MAG: DUF4180 domain-containing protein [Bacteroidetes bacterium HGW-Bacteroidetes-10]|jgi:hypothetical protein|nr:MAG: DUF4180 domain-containing protein [Bacteroidetes bacterium HGW-Bacteroidetes-10]
MQLTLHSINNIKIGEITSDKIILKTTEDGLTLLGDLYYQGYDKIILHEKNITPQFFDLKTGIAGEILQKFAQYRIPLAIVGDFSKYTSNSLRDFIFESNKGKFISFVSTREEAIKILADGFYK